MSMRVCTFAISTLFLFVHVSVSAVTLPELQQADKLRIRTWIEPKQDIIAKQQVQLHIEVTTDRWFSSGTRFGRFEIEDAIVLQRDNFALNSTLNQNGKSWTVQQWTLVVYPQRDGEFIVPAIPVYISIAGENQQTITGQLNTKPMRFVAKIPNKLQDINNWIVTTRYEITSSFNRTIEGLKPGDALIRTIQLSADDLPAMMLPTVDLQDISGVAIYQKPPVVTDKVNRGDYLAERTETLTYVFERPGEYQLSAQTYYWWNLKSAALASIKLAATTLRVTGSSPTGNLDTDNSESAIQNNDVDILSLLIQLGLVLLLVLAVWIVSKRLRQRRKNTNFTKSNENSEKSLRQQFEKACRNKERVKALQLFYRWLDGYGGESFRTSIRRRLTGQDRSQAMIEFNELMGSIYTSEKKHDIDLRRFACQFMDDVKLSNRSRRHRRWAVELRLN